MQGVEKKQGLPQLVQLQLGRGLLGPHEMQRVHHLRGHPTFHLLQANRKCSTPLILNGQAQDAGAPARLNIPVQNNDYSY